jgi:hypothetical protein
MEEVETRMTLAFERLEDQMIGLKVIERQMKTMQSMAVKYWRLWLELTQNKEVQNAEDVL